MWHPFFNYDSGHDLALISATVTVPAEYRLTTSLPQTETVHGGVRTVHGASLHPEFLLSLIYDREWRPVTTMVGSLRFESFLTPAFRFSHDSLARALGRVYEVLTPRFGEAQLPTHYLAVVEHRGLTGSGFTVRMNNAVVSGDNATRLEETVLGPSAGFAHEVAHGWTMNASGPAANMLREGWATFAEAIVLRAEHGADVEAAFWDRLRAAYMTGLDRSGRGAGFQGRQSILGDPDNGRIHYYKGSWILHELEDVLGQAAFDRGMRDYIQHTGRGPSGYEEFIAAMSRAAGRGHDMAPFIMPWLAGKYIPDVDARVDGGQLIVTQDQPGELFDLLLEVELTAGSSMVRRSVHLTRRADTVTIAGLGPIREVRVDPDHHFLLVRHWGDTARFELRAPAAKTAELVGNFLAKPMAAARDGDVWSVQLPMTEGRYIWLWRVDGKTPADSVAIASAAAGGDAAIAGVRTVRGVRRIVDGYPK